MAFEKRLRVASYNIHKAVGVDRRRDPHRIMDVINSLDADVVALQEADLRLGDRVTTLDRRVLDIGTDFQVAELARNDVSLGWHGNAILVRKGLQINAVDHIDLPGLEPRGAVRVDIGSEAGNLSVVGAHLGLLRPSRRAQLARIMAHLAAQGLSESLIMGDFNEWSETAGLEILDQSFQLVSPGKSFHAAYPLAGLDRLALSRGLELYDAGVQQSDTARLASDHLPIWGDVTWRS